MAQVNPLLALYGYAVAICVFLIIYLAVKLTLDRGEELPRAGRYLLWAIVAIISAEVVGSLASLNPFDYAAFNANLTFAFMFSFIFIFLGECTLYLISMIYIGRRTGTLRFKR